MCHCIIFRINPRVNVFSNTTVLCFIVRQFHQLDNVSGETATSSSQGRAKIIPILHTLSQLQDSHRFHKSFSQQFQVAKLPVQWMPFPQYPQKYRIRILHLGTPGYPPEYQRNSSYKAWTTRTLILHVHSDSNSNQTYQAITDL